LLTQLTMTSRTALITLAALPAALGIVRPDGIGRLPALGWNSWVGPIFNREFGSKMCTNNTDQNAYFCDVNQTKIMQAANAMVDLGFKDAGYEYLILDDCWSEMNGRDPVTSRLVPNTTKFPDGMSGTADKVHALGLKYGMYSSAGTMTCGRYPGSLGYEAIDAATFAEWGVDYLKVSAGTSWVGSVGTVHCRRRSNVIQCGCPLREMFCVRILSRTRTDSFPHCHSTTIVSLRRSGSTTASLATATRTSTASAK